MSLCHFDPGGTIAVSTLPARGSRMPRRPGFQRQIQMPKT